MSSSGFQVELSREWAPSGRARQEGRRKTLLLSVSRINIRSGVANVTQVTKKLQEGRTLPCSPFRPALTHHQLAIGVERVVDNPLGRVQGVIILEPETPKAFGNRLEPRGLRLVPEGVVGVGAIHDSREKHERGIRGEPVLLHNRVEGTLLPVVSQLHAFHVIGGRLLPFGDGHYLIGGHEQKLRLRIDEFADEPRTSYPVDMNVRSRYPFHCR